MNQTTQSSTSSTSTNGDDYFPSASTSATTLESSLSWPLATDSAAATFIQLSTSTYQSKQLGSVTYFDEQEAICDCSFESGQCDELSQCMNRLLQIECLPTQCRAGSRCQNQRFQNQQYANIDIVQTNKKGFGVRAGEDLLADEFVYEYVGEVIGPSLFQKRIRDYATQGIKHFYFMALDRDVFIDATKKGGWARFLNHSCNPNCVVAKWSVGNKQRMGIFAKRNIKKGEELTFNYNVDRYGHDAQECFCGEPNCVGWIGGKTQTDLGGMDQLYLDALGLNGQLQEDQLVTKSKKKKSRKLDDVEDSILLEPVGIDQVAKVSAALRQAITTKPILDKLLQRINQTTNESVHLALLRLHGFNSMKHILAEYSGDLSLVEVVLSILLKWPLIVKNKVDSSRIEPVVAQFTNSSNPAVADSASSLIDYWSTLSLGYRIPKQDSTSSKRPIEINQIDQIAKRPKPDLTTPQPIQPPRHIFIKPEATVSSPSLHSPVGLIPIGVPLGWRIHRDPLGRAYYENSLTQQVQWTVPTTPAEGSTTSKAQVDVSSIVAKVQRDALAARPPPNQSPTSSAQPTRVSRDRDKRVMQLFSSVVVSVMSHYRHEFEGEAFKRRAREVTQVLCDKERKHPSYSTSDYYKLSPDKISKLKTFTKQWINKLVDRKRQGTPTSTEDSAFSPIQNPP